MTDRASVGVGERSGGRRRAVGTGPSGVSRRALLTGLGAGTLMTGLSGCLGVRDSYAAVPYGLPAAAALALGFTFGDYDRHVLDTPVPVVGDVRLVNHLVWYAAHGGHMLLPVGVLSVPDATAFGRSLNPLASLSPLELLVEGVRTAVVWQLLASLGLTRGEFHGWDGDPERVGGTDAEFLGQPTVVETFLATARGDRAVFALLLNITRVRLDDSVVFVASGRSTPLVDGDDDPREVFDRRKIEAAMESMQRVLPEVADIDATNEIGDLSDRAQASVPATDTGGGDRDSSGGDRNTEERDAGRTDEHDTGATEDAGPPPSRSSNHSPGTYDAPENAKTPIVSTRGHYFEDNLFRERLTEGHTTTDYETTGGVPGLETGDCPDTLVVYVHGFQNDDSDAAANFNLTRAALRRNGYNGPVVGFSWDSNTGPTDFGDADYRARLNGAKLGSFLLDFACHCPETKLRLISHSLGARVLLETVRWLHRSDRWEGCDGEIVTVQLLGAAVDETALGDERYRDAIRDEVGTLWNYYNHEDDVLSATYWAGGGGDALGEAGRQRDYSWSPLSYGDDPTPDNVRERDVSDEVGDDHSGYNTPTSDSDANDPEGDGVIDDVYADWNE